MSLTLAQINLGTAPAGKDGDTQRTANSKTNDNMAAIAAAVNDLSTNVQANTAAIATKAAQSAVDLKADKTAVDLKADKTVTDALQASVSSFIGAVAMFGRNTAPAGWLKANGALVSRATYATLFAAIGTTFGAGDGATTFALPDLRGEFPRGWDDGRGVDSGRAFGSWQADDLKAHAHGAGVAANGGAAASFAAGASSPTATYNTNNSGGAETRPRNVALLACIRYS